MQTKRLAYPSSFGSLIALGCAFVLVLASGCGYRLQGSGTVLPKDIKTVGIAPVENKTTESGLGPRFQEELRSRFDLYGAISVVDNPEQADAVLTATIVDIESAVDNVTGQTDVAEQYRLALIISVELRRQNGQLLWRDPSLTVSDDYSSSTQTVVTSSASFAQGDINAGTLNTLGSAAVSRGQQDSALNDLLEEASRKIYLAAVAEDF